MARWSRGLLDRSVSICWENVGHAGRFAARHQLHFFRGRQRLSGHFSRRHRLARESEVAISLKFVLAGLWLYQRFREQLQGTQRNLNNLNGFAKVGIMTNSLI